jgi:acyl-CoA reductase-like NAD-dependent aldehyde dehydrogenase
VQSSEEFPLNQIDSLSSYSLATRAFVDQGRQLFIGGRFTPSRSGGTLPVIDPASGDIVGSIAAGTAADIDDAVAAAKRVAENETWSRMAPEPRERLIMTLAELVDRDIERLAEIEALDVGMPLATARWLIGSSVSTLRYMAGWPSKIEGRTIPVAPAMPGEYFACTVREPVGVIGAIIPWNAPFMMAVWKIAPALATGCSIIVKPAEDACLSVFALAEHIRNAGIPEGVVNIVSGRGIESGEALVRHPDIARISFTGSTATGRSIAKLAADTTKKVSLELGGKSPQVVFADANLDLAVPGAANAVFMNTGQVCVAGSRLYVPLHEAKVGDRPEIKGAAHVFRRRLQDWAAPARAKIIGVVDEYIECSESVGRMLYYRIDAVKIGDVELNTDRYATARRNVFDRDVDCFPTSRQYCNFCSLTCEGNRNRAPEAAPGARHQRHLTLQPSHHHPLLW